MSACNDAWSTLFLPPRRKVTCTVSSPFSIPTWFSVATPVQAERVEVRGAHEVARRAQTFSRTGLLRHPALVNGAPGLVCTREGKPFSVLAFTVTAGKIAEINILHDPERLAQLDLTALTP